MTIQQQIDGLTSAKSKVNVVRANHTLFELPLADAKLVRVSNYIYSQIAELERQQWEELGMLEAVNG